MPSWLVGPVAGVVIRRVLPVLLGALAGLAGDAGLLDGALVAQLQTLFGSS